MTKSFLMRFALFFVVLSVQAQTEFRPGYIIKTSQDTLRGWLKYSETQDQYRIARFKGVQDGAEESFSPTQLLGYGFERDKSFESAELVSDTGESIQVFYQILVGGSVDLLKYQSYFYVRGDDGVIRHLDNSKSKENINGKQYVKKSERYKGTLSLMFTECEEVKKKTTNLSFGERKLIEIVEAYNRCVGDEVEVYKNDKKWFAARFSAALGYNASQIRFTTNQDKYEYLTEGFNTAHSFMPGLSVTFNSPRINERLSLYLGVFYLKTEYIGNTLSSTSVTSTRNYVEINLEQFKVPIGIRYAFPMGKVLGYANGGFVITSHLEKSFFARQERETFLGVETLIPESFPLNDSQIGWWLGFGVEHDTFKKAGLFLEARIDRSSGILDNQRATKNSFANNITNFQLLLGINF